MTRRWIALLIVPVSLSGCGGHPASGSSSPLGRTLDAEAASTSDTPAPGGDPPAERDGTVPAGQAAKQNTLTAGALARSPRAALERYALACTNWHASGLSAHERQIAALAVGAARLAPEQTATSQSAAAELAADHVQNKGVVLAITPGHGPARGQWVVVTQEQTIGTGPYAGLPAAPHVTLARVTRLERGFAVSDGARGASPNAGYCV
jgi:hypothetical protein